MSTTTLHALVTGSVIGGKAGDGLIVWTPLPGILNVMVSGPGLALASRIACTSDPGPELLVLMTTYVFAWATAAKMNSAPIAAMPKRIRRGQEICLVEFNFIGLTPSCFLQIRSRCFGAGGISMQKELPVTTLICRFVRIPTRRDRGRAVFTSGETNLGRKMNRQDLHNGLEGEESPSP